MKRNEALYEAVLKGKRKDVATIVQELVDQDTNLEEILMGSMVPAMAEIGERFSRNEAYVPEMLIAARAMQAGLDILDPLLAQAGHEPIGKVAIGTVKGDLHDIGKNLVAMMLKGAGFEVIDLGVDCDTEKYREAIEENNVQIVLLSALLTTTMPYMKEIVVSLADNPVKVMVGGAPVTQEYADEIGADGYSDDANTAVKVAKQILGIAA